MIDFSKDYIELLKSVKYLLSNKDSDISRKIEAEDVISIAYISFCDKKLEYTKNLFLKECNIVILELKREIIYKNKKITYYFDDECKKCFTCKKILPVSEYGITKVYRYNGEYQNANCKQCVRDKAKKWNNDNKERAKKRLLEFKRKSRNNLTDYYLIQILRKKHSMEYIKNNPYLLINLRTKIIKKRKSKIYER